MRPLRPIGLTWRFGAPILRSLAALALLASTACTPTADGPPPMPQQMPMPPPLPPAPPALPLELPPTAQLPADVRPTHYTLVLQVDPERERLAGTVEIAIELARPRDVIWLHGRGLNVRAATVRPDGAGPQPAKWFQTDSAGVVMLRLAQPVGPGRATVRVDYDAPFGERLEGVHRVSRGGKRYAFTQFEPAFARQAFPSFDEPRFKTPFDVTLFVPRDDEAVANTHEIERVDAPGGLRRVTFATTQKIPSYLVAFAVGPLDIVSAPPVPPNLTRSRPLPLRGIAVKGRGGELKYALEHTGEIVAALEGYFGIEYPYDKLDILAVPGQQGAMENPGAVTFGERLLMIDEKTAPVEQRRAYAGVMAHELAHQWFGDLVTMSWWNDTWLNEAFATWMQTRTVAAWHPDYHPEVAACESVQEAMRVDSQVSARQIRQEVRDLNDVQNAFDGITYQKGAGVLAMFEQWVGPDKFQKGIQQYLAEHRFGSATADDLLATLSAVAQKDVGTPFRTFLQQPGVPLVEASLRCDGKKSVLHLRQSRYLPLGSSGDPNRTWQIPICARYPGDHGRHETCTLLKDVEGDLPLDTCPAWIIPNAGAAGYYRWTLPPADMKKLERDGFAKLDVRERMSVGNAILAGFGRGTTSGANAFAELAPFASDPSRSVAVIGMDFWRSVSRWFDKDALYGAAQGYARTAYTPAFNQLGWGSRRAAEDEDRKLLRGEVLGLLALSAKDPAIRRDAAARGRAYVGFGKDGAIHPEAVDPNLAATALTVAVQEGDAVFFDGLVARLATTNDDVVRGRLLWALGSVTRPDLAARALELALDPRLAVREVMTPIRAQLEQPETRDAAWEWLKSHLDAVVARLPPARAARVMSLGAYFCDQPHYTDLAQLFTARLGSMEGGPRELASAMEAIQLCAARRSTHEASVRAFLQKQPGAPPAGAQPPPDQGRAPAPKKRP